jgi:hypothetical protein
MKFLKDIKKTFMNLFDSPQKRAERKYQEAKAKLERLKEDYQNLESANRRERPPMFRQNQSRLKKQIQTQEGLVKKLKTQTKLILV